MAGFGWLALSLTMSSGLINAVACVQISFLQRLNNIPLFTYTTFCLYIHLLESTWVASIYFLKSKNFVSNLSKHKILFINTEIWTSSNFLLSWNLLIKPLEKLKKKKCLAYRLQKTGGGQIWTVGQSLLTHVLEFKNLKESLTVCSLKQITTNMEGL